MSGSMADLGEELIPMSEQIKVIMAIFGVSEKGATSIAHYAKEYATERMKKWVNNYRKLQKAKADEIYRLLRLVKKGNKNVINDLEKKILELCVQ
jgi:hypothetical protein